MCLTQAAATRWPVETEPVKEIASIFGMVEHRLTDAGAATHDEVEHALGSAGAHDDFGERMRGAGHEVGGLEHDRIAVAERGRDLPGGNGDGEVPRRDNADDADGLARHLDVDARADGTEFLARDAQGLTGEEVEDLRGAADFADGFRQRFAFLAREQAAEFVAAGGDLGRDLQQHVVAFLRRRARPAVQRGAGGLDGLVDLAGVGLRIFADHVVGVGRGHVAADGNARRPFSGDVVLVQVGHRRFPQGVRFRLHIGGCARRV